MAGPPEFDRTVDTWCSAYEAGDHAAMIETLAHDFIPKFPITERIRFEGVEQADDAYLRVFQISDEFRVFDRARPRRSRPWSAAPTATSSP